MAANTVTEVQPLPGQLAVVDQYSPLDHKVIMTSPTFDHLPRWVPVSSRRRLTSYLLLDGYYRNVARTFLRNLPDDPNRQDAWQELGDVQLIVKRIAGSILGKDPELVIDGADDPLPEIADIRSSPPEPDAATLTPLEFAVMTEAFVEAAAAWRAEAAADLERWRQQVAVRPGLQARQRWLRDWGNKERVLPKMVENERDNIVKLGDGLYVLGFDEDRNRPTIEIYEPDCYFPDLETRPVEFPDRVNLAWPLKKMVGGREVPHVRRITYELVDIRGLDRTQFNLGDQAGYLQPGQEQTHVCLLTDGEWPLSALERTDLADLDDAAEYRTTVVDGTIVELRRYPLGYDFIPIVHMPHTLATKNHFGESPLLALAQLFDEIAATDTNEARATAWAARPPFTVSGMSQSPGDNDRDKARANTLDVSPGKAWKVKEGGGVDVVDMAQGLAAVGQRLKDLLKRLSVNGEVPEGLIGRVDASEVPSGLALTLSFTSHLQATDSARMARTDKLSLLLKMVQRIQIHHTGGFPNGDGEIVPDIDVYDASVAFGAFMPQDLSGAVEIVSRALNAFAMSQETAIQLLVENGVPVDDIADELSSIRSRMTEAARFLAEATDSFAAAREFLGLPVAADSEDGGPSGGGADGDPPDGDPPPQAEPDGDPPGGE